MDSIEKSESVHESDTCSTERVQTINIYTFKKDWYKRKTLCVKQQVTLVWCYLAGVIFCFPADPLKHWSWEDFRDFHDGSQNARVLKVKACGRRVALAFKHTHTHIHTPIMDTRGFRAMLLSISDKLTDENVKSLKFVCTDIGKKRLERINTGIELFECLIERAEIGPDNTELLRKLLNDIGQAVLLEIIEDYERYSTRTDDGLDANEREKITIASDVIVEQLGKKWLQVGRKLGLQQTHLEGIQEKHSRDLEEQVRELIRQWVKIRREKARVEELIKALRDCKQNLTADLVEKRLREHQNSP